MCGGEHRRPNSDAELHLRRLLLTHAEARVDMLPLTQLHIRADPQGELDWTLRVDLQRLAYGSSGRRRRSAEEGRQRLLLAVAVVLEATTLLPLLALQM